MKDSKNQQVPVLLQEPANNVDAGTHVDLRCCNSMQIVYSYQSGRAVVAEVLAVGAGFVRAVAPKRPDAFDLYLRDEDWVTETGTAIRVDAIVFGDRARLPSAATAKRGYSTRRRLDAAVAGASGA